MSLQNQLPLRPHRTDKLMHRLFLKLLHHLQWLSIQVQHKGLPSTQFLLLLTLKDLKGQFHLAQYLQEVPIHHLGRPDLPPLQEASRDMDNLLLRLL